MPRYKRVLARFGNGEFYPGSIKVTNSDTDTVEVQYDDGDYAIVPLSDVMTRETIFQMAKQCYKKGDCVISLWTEDEGGHTFTAKGTVVNCYDNCLKVAYNGSVVSHTLEDVMKGPFFDEGRSVKQTSNSSTTCEGVRKSGPFNDFEAQVVETERASKGGSSLISRSEAQIATFIEKSDASSRPAEGVAEGAAEGAAEDAAVSSRPAEGAAVSSRPTAAAGRRRRTAEDVAARITFTGTYEYKNFKVYINNQVVYSHEQGGWVDRKRKFSTMGNLQSEKSKKTVLGISRDCLDR